MQFTRKIYTTVLLIILMSINFIVITPTEVKAATRLGINLFSNPGFDLNSSNISPFKVESFKGMETAEIQKGIGVNGTSALRLVTKLSSEGIIYGLFNVHANSKYRLSASACRAEPDDPKFYIGVKDYYGVNDGSSKVSMSFDGSYYENKYVDFTVGARNSTANAFFYFPAPTFLYKAGGYVDNFVLEETAYPPTIDEIEAPSIATEITGTAEPGKEVKITLPDNRELTAITDNNGIYTIPIEEGTLKQGDELTAVQYGLYDIESLPTAYTIPRKRLGINYYPNPKFDVNYNIAPLDRTGSGSFEIKQIDVKEGSGIGATNYLKIATEINKAGEIRGIFDVIPNSNYRASMYAKRAEDTTEAAEFHMGVKLFDNLGSDEHSDSYKPNEAEYLKKEVNFRVGETNTKASFYIYFQRSGLFTSNSAFVDDLVFEETSYPPTINPVNDASNCTITGKAEPGMKVKIILPGGKGELTGIVGNDDTYSITPPQGILKDGDTITAVQIGLYDTDSAPTEITVGDTIPPSPPKISLLQDTDAIIHGTAEANSTVTITLPDKSIEEVTADSDSYFELPLNGRVLKIDEIVSATAKDFNGNVSGPGVRKVLPSANITIDEDANIGIFGKDFTINLGEVDNLTHEEIIELSEAKAFTLDTDMDLESNLTILTDELKYRPGVYPIHLTVENVTHTIYVTVESYNSKVEISSILLNGTEEVSNIQRINGTPKDIVPEILVVLKNTSNDKEYVGFLKHGEKLIYSEIQYGDYEVTCITPPDVEFSNTNMPQNKFTLTKENSNKIFTITSNFVELRGFGSIDEKNDVSLIE